MLKLIRSSVLLDHLLPGEEAREGEGADAAEHAHHGQQPAGGGVDGLDLRAGGKRTGRTHVGLWFMASSQLGVELMGWICRRGSGRTGQEGLRLDGTSCRLV